MTDRPARSTLSTLPLGYLSLAPDGTVSTYSPFDSVEGAPDPDEVVGRNFFHELVDAPELAKLEESFKAFVSNRIQDPYLSADLLLRHARHQQRVHVGFVRSPLKNEVILTVSQLDHTDLPLSAQVRPDAVQGTLRDAAGLQVVVANEDFWHAVEQLLARVGGDRLATMHRFGMEWGLAHAVRVESFVQRETNRTLRELELEVALEYLSGSLAVVGLGHFEADLSHRLRGLVVVDHHASPFPDLLAETDGKACGLLAGFHAGVFSYLSGRGLKAVELFCSSGAEGHCRFILGTEERLRSLSGPGAEAADHELLASLRIAPPA